MEYRKEKLELMSDLNINKEVARLSFDFYDEIRVTQAPSQDSSVWVECDGGLENTNYDPCNNPSDIIPLVFEYNISLLDPESNGRNEWQAGKFYPDFTPDIQVQHKNPLRAAAIVYILIKQ